MQKALFVRSGILENLLNSGTPTTSPHTYGQTILGGGYLILNDVKGRCEMGVGIKFIEPSNDVFILTFGSKWPDGNGFFNEATITFLYIKGIVIARKAIVHNYYRDVFITLCPDWDKPPKRIEYVCKFLREGKAKTQKKLKDEDIEYTIRKLPNHYDYKW